MRKNGWRSFLVLWWVLILLPLGPASARGEELPESAYISGFTGHAQTYSLSCESRSAVDWAAFWGVSISESEFQASLPRSDNPDAGYVGDWNGPWGFTPPNAYGVHAGPVAALLKQYGLRARAARGLQWNDLRAEVAAGRPAIVWIIGAMWPGHPVRYKASDGQRITVARFEHTMILIGYDAERVHVVDAYTGWTQTYGLGAFLASWEVLGNMAVLGRGPRSLSPPASGGNRTYTVQPGDTLAAVGRRVGVAWPDLAALNAIQYPYTIYVGQELTLPQGEASDPPKRGRKKTPTPAAPLDRGSYSLWLPFVHHPPMQASAEEPYPAGAGKKQPKEGDLPETYVVQRGEYLIQLAERFGLDWRDLAERNELDWPWVIHPGQVLKLK